MLLNCHFYSPVLLRDTEIHVILPTPMEEGAPVPQDVPVLYLLHGLTDGASGWLRYSNIERYARVAGMAVVMPGVHNSFYQDMAHGERFFTYLTRELPAFIQGLFPVSRKREKTFIAGLSMGGYGAWLAALRCPELYGAAASFSGVVDIGFRVSEKPVPPGLALPDLMESCFGDFSRVAHSDRDLIHLYEKSAGRDLPRLYQSCGTADYLYEMNKNTHRALADLGAPITWREIPGKAHEWDCWDSEIRYLLEHWL